VRTKRQILVQGKGAADWVTSCWSRRCSAEARLGYEDVLNPKPHAPHMGVDEKRQGDFFGPLVIAVGLSCTTRTSRRGLKAMNRARQQDHHCPTKAAQDLAKKTIRARLGDRFAVVSIASGGSKPGSTPRWAVVNRILAGGHARANRKNLWKKVPSCPPGALSDQFGPEQQIQRALAAEGPSDQAGAAPQGRKRRRRRRRFHPRGARAS
jgi:hypothetical protein